MSVKGISVLASFIDVANQNQLDFMHQAYRGVVDKLLTPLLGPSSHKGPWTITKRSTDFVELDRLQLQVLLMFITLSLPYHA